MVRDSWKTKPKRKTKSLTDGNGVEHIANIRERTEIKFQIDEHRMSDHETIIAFFQESEDVHVEYLNDHTGTYEVGVFHIDEIQWQHKKTFDSDIWYEKTQITMTEY